MTHTATIDVMLNNGRKFYRTLRYHYCSLFNIKFEEFVTWAIDRLPSLKWRKDAILFVKFPDGSEYEIKLNQKK